jgi:hypothetical protein
MVLILVLLHDYPVYATLLILIEFMAYAYFLFKNFPHTDKFTNWIHFSTEILFILGLIIVLVIVIENEVQVT